MPSVPFNFRVSSADGESLATNAQAAGLSRADYVRELIRQDVRRRTAWSVPADTADDEALMFRAGAGDTAALRVLAHRYNDRFNAETDVYRLVELMGAIIVFARLAAASGDGFANADLADVLAARASLADDMGEHDFAGLMRVHAIARYELALRAGVEGISHRFEQAIGKAGPAAVEDVRTLTDTIAADTDAVVARV